METDASGLFFLLFKTVKQPILIHSIFESCKEVFYASAKKKEASYQHKLLNADKIFGKESMCSIQDSFFIHSH
jgi:hypothetical protein